MIQECKEAMANGFQQCSATVKVLNGAKANGSVFYGVGSLRKPLPLSIFGEEEEEEEAPREVLEDEAADSSTAKAEEEEFGFFESAPAAVENGSTSISVDELGFGDFTTGASQPPGAAEAPEDFISPFGEFSAAPGNDGCGSLPTPPTNDWLGESLQPQSSLNDWVSAAPTSSLMLAMHGIHGRLKPSAGDSDRNSSLPAPTNVVNAKAEAAEDSEDWGDFVEPEMGTAVTSPALLALPAPSSKDRVKANGSHFQMLDLISLDAPLMLDMHSGLPAETASKGGDLLLLSWDDDPVPATEIPVSAIEVNGQAGMKADVEDLLVLCEDSEPVEAIVGVEGVTAVPVAAFEVDGQTGKKTDGEEMESIAAAVEVNGQTVKKTDVEDLLAPWEDGVPVEPIVGVEGVTAAPVAAVEVNDQTWKKTDGEDLLVGWDDGQLVEPIVGVEGVAVAEEAAETTASSMTTDPEGVEGLPASYARSTSGSFTDLMSSFYPEPEEKSTTIGRSQSSGKLTGEYATEYLSSDLFGDQIKEQTSVPTLENKTSELVPSDLFKDEGIVNHRTTDEFSSAAVNSIMIDFLDFEGPLPSDSSINGVSYVDMLAELKVQTMDDDQVLANRQQIQSGYVKAWDLLASACTAELNHALEIWREATGTRCRNQVLATEQGRSYYLAVAEVYKVAGIIEASAKVYIGWLNAAPELKSSLQTALVQCGEAWFSLDGAVEPAAAEAVKKLQDALVSLVECSLPVGDLETSQEHCCLSLLPFHSVPGVDVAQWRGRRCFLPVANFWANRVSCDPPFATC